MKRKRGQPVGTCRCGRGRSLGDFAPAWDWTLVVRSRHRCWQKFGAVRAFYRQRRSGNFMRGQGR